MKTNDEIDFDVREYLIDSFSVITHICRQIILDESLKGRAEYFDRKKIEIMRKYISSSKRNADAFLLFNDTDEMGKILKENINRSKEGLSIIDKINECINLNIKSDELEMKIQHIKNNPFSNSNEKNLVKESLINSFKYLNSIDSFIDYLCMFIIFNIIIKNECINKESFIELDQQDHDNLIDYYNILQKSKCIINRLCECIDLSKIDKNLVSEINYILAENERLLKSIQ